MNGRRKSIFAGIVAAVAVIVGAVYAVFKFRES